MGVFMRKKGYYFEQLAIKYLSKRAYVLLGNNVTFRDGEIDLIFNKDEIYHFIEVKSLNSKSEFPIYVSFTKRKKSRIMKAVNQYRSRNNLYEKLWQIDFICIIVKRDILEIEYFENIDMNLL